MPKNITVSEGDKGRNFGPERKLETPLQTSGMQLWIPEDEANDYATKTPLEVSANGTYTPSVGGYNPVTVNVETKVDHIEITENGEYKAEDKGLDGFNRVAVAVPNLAHLQQGTFTANGTYNPAEGYDGFNRVSVSVPVPDGITVLDSGVQVQTGDGTATTINYDGSMSVGTTGGDPVVVDADGTIH